MVERGGRVVTEIVPNSTAPALAPSVRHLVQKGSTVITDRNLSYNTVSQGRKYTHLTVNHSRGYVDGYAHTNTIDGFWSLVKRGIKGVYYQVSLPHSQSHESGATPCHNRRVCAPCFRCFRQSGL